MSSEQATSTSTAAAAAAAAPSETPKAPAEVTAPSSAAPVDASAAATPPEPETPLTKLAARLADIIHKAGHGEMWGVELSPSSGTSGHAPTQVVLLKFLRANSNDVAATEKQLTAALEWRKTMQPTKLVSEAFDRKKFNDLGFVTVHEGQTGGETVITWNIYGAVKDNKSTFGNVKEFIRWRTALMELGVQKLRLNDIKEPLAEDAQDPYQMLQVHDYLSVSFFRMDPAVKAASKETIETFSMAYPELLAHKYFVNVPAVMGWMYSAMKLFLAPTTLRKFHPMRSGTTLSTELKDISASLPKEYGGQGPSVKEGETVKLADAEPKVEEEKSEKGQDAEVANVDAADAAAAAEAAPAAVEPEAKPELAESAAEEHAGATLSTTAAAHGDSQTTEAKISDSSTQPVSKSAA